MGQHMYLIQVRIMLHHRAEFILYQKMYFCIRYLQLQAADNGGGEYNITDGGKPDDKELKPPRPPKGGSRNSLSIEVFILQSR